MNRKVFAARRRAFMDRMQGGVALIAAAPIRSRNSDVDYEYRQDSDFHYLTGFDEPESVCLLAPGHSKYEYVLFVRPRDKEKETWTGRRAGVEGAVRDFDAEMAHASNMLEEILPEFLQNIPHLYYFLNRYPETDARILAAIETVRQRHRAGIYPPAKIVDPGEILSDMRLIKATDELEAIQRAVDISTAAHVAAMKATAPERFEYEIQAVLEYFFRASGSMRNGYPCIVGSGPNTCILHYNSNDRKMQTGDLLLIDAGAEFDYYSADITRTYPVNGKFNAEQKAVYEIVLAAQKAAISAVKPGITYMYVHETAVQVLTQGMIDLGLLSGTVQENIENENYKKYYLHRTGHWLGLDVHDVGKYKLNDQWRALEPGMLVTVEPGLYIGEEDEHTRFQNIGVRIEDDVLVTESGSRVLSAACPKEIADLENIIGSAGKAGASSVPERDARVS